MKYRIVILGLITLLAACKDRIPVELGKGEQPIVIDGVLTNELGQTLKLSRSGDFYQLDGYGVVNDAQVFVEDSMGQIIPFIYTQEGRYEAVQWQPQLNQRYTLHIELEDQEYSAQTQLLSPIKIKQLDVKFNNDSTAYIRCKFKDPEDQKNFYRLRFIRNGEIQESRLYDLKDDSFNGQNKTYNFKREPIAYGDTIVVELWHIPQFMFDYYNQLEDVISQGLLSSVPYNPENKITGNAVGFWGGAAIDRDTIYLRL